jgi:hypothetical protein
VPRSFLFFCPTTGMTVQGTMLTEPPINGPPLYEPIECMSCKRLHIVNVATLRRLSEERSGNSF